MPMTRPWCIRGALILLALLPMSAFAQWSCAVAGKGTALAALSEVSGLAASQGSAGLLWAHNDGEAALYAIEKPGTAPRRYAVTAASAGDWEAVAVGPCPGGRCVYIGDIGDNDGSRANVVIHRVPEPGNGSDATARVESLRGTYPDGPQDAEAMFVLPDGALYVVTKGERGPVTLYRVPEFKGGATVRFEKVATLASASGKNNQVARKDRITDASASRDGRWVALRTLQTVRFYNAKELTAGTVRPVFEFDVRTAGEAQGEGITFGSGNEVWLASEGGGKKRPGTLTKLVCAVPGND